MSDRKNTHKSAATECECVKRKMEQGRIIINEARTLLRLSPINDSQCDQILKKE
jgi:hypothetical protein